MDIQKIHTEIIHVARGLADSDDRKQEWIIAELQTMRDGLNACLRADLAATTSPEADEFARRNVELAQLIVLALIRSIHAMDQAIGHDRIHLAFDLYEGIHSLAEEPMHPCDELVAILASIGHDIGRYGEEKVFGKPMATQVHTWFSCRIMERVGELALQMAHADDRPLWQAVWRRVIGCIIAHFGANDISDPLRHHVQSCDRLAGILGIRDFARNLACDLHLRGARFWPDERLNAAWEMAPFNNMPPDAFANAPSMKQSWTNVVHYVEAPMRTCFPLASPKMESRADAMKVQAARLLTLLGDGVAHGTMGDDRPLTLAEQIFAPELVAYDGIPLERFGPTPAYENLTRWDKADKTLPERVWREVWNKTYDHENMKRMWPAIPKDIWSKMNGSLHDAWRFSGADTWFETVGLIKAFLGMHAYTLNEKRRDDVVAAIFREQRGDGRSSLAYAFAFASAEAQVCSAMEHEELLRLRGMKADHPLIATIASAIVDEPIFGLNDEIPY